MIGFPISPTRRRPPAVACPLSTRLGGRPLPPVEGSLHSSPVVAGPHHPSMPEEQFEQFHAACAAWPAADADADADTDADAATAVPFESPAEVQVQLEPLLRRLPSRYAAATSAPVLASPAAQAVLLLQRRPHAAPRAAQSSAAPQVSPPAPQQVSPPASQVSPPAPSPMAQRFNRESPPRSTCSRLRASLVSVGQLPTASQPLAAPSPVALQARGPTLPLFTAHMLMHMRPGTSAPAVDARAPVVAAAVVAAESAEAGAEAGDEEAAAAATAGASTAGASTSTSTSTSSIVIDAADADDADDDANDAALRQMSGVFSFSVCHGLSSEELTLSTVGVPTPASGQAAQCRPTQTPPRPRHLLATRDGHEQRHTTSDGHSSSDAPGRRDSQQRTPAPAPLWLQQDRLPIGAGQVWGPGGCHVSVPEGAAVETAVEASVPETAVEAAAAAAVAVAAPAPTPRAAGRASC